MANGDNIDPKKQEELNARKQEGVDINREDFEILQNKGKVLEEIFQKYSGQNQLLQQNAASQLDITSQLKEQLKNAGENKEEGAGDQGIMFGFACRDTEVLMPAAIHYSHKILQSLATARHNGEANILGPDSKSQITLEHLDGKPVKATSVVVSTQHIEDASQSEIKELVSLFLESLSRDVVIKTPSEAEPAISINF